MVGRSWFIPDPINKMIQQHKRENTNLRNSSAIQHGKERGLLRHFQPHYKQQQLIQQQLQSQQQQTEDEKRGSGRKQIRNVLLESTVQIFFECMTTTKNYGS